MRKLQAALASTEAFPVLSSRLAPPAAAGGGRSMSRSGSLGGSFSAPGSLSSGLQALQQPFKLRLVRHQQVGGWVGLARPGPARPGFPGSCSA